MTYKILFFIVNKLIYEFIFVFIQLFENFINYDLF